MFSSPFNRMMSAFRGLGRSDYHTRPEVDRETKRTKPRRGKDGRTDPDEVVDRCR